MIFLLADIKRPERPELATKALECFKFILKIVFSRD